MQGLYASSSPEVIAGTRRQAVIEQLYFLQGLKRKTRAGKVEQGAKLSELCPLGKLHRRFGHALAQLTNLSRDECQRWGDEGLEATPPVSVMIHTNRGSL